MTRIRTEVAAATTQSTNHYTITASYRSPGTKAFLVSFSVVIRFPSLHVTERPTYGAGFQPKAQSESAQAHCAPASCVLSCFGPLA